METFKSICKNNVYQKKDDLDEEYYCHDDLIIGTEYEITIENHHTDLIYTFIANNEHYMFFDNLKFPNTFINESKFSNFFYTKDEMLKLKLETLISENI